MSTRPEITAQHREITGKAVARLRRAGQVPAVLYGHGEASQSLQIEARALDDLRRRTGRNALLDLYVDGGQAQPVMITALQEHPVTRRPLHVDFFMVSMTEELTIEVPVAYVGESVAVEKLGGTLLHLLDTVRVRTLPADVPAVLEVDVSPLDTFEVMLHVSDLRVPERVTILTDGHEPLARVQAPRIEEAPVVAPTEPVEAPETPAEDSAEPTEE
ncbi:MAG: 50S ribosomal protein L25 [Candidatus Limnocylindrales bacterium]